MNPLLSQLMRHTASRFGDAGGAVQLVTIVPDATTQPPRLYAAFASDDGLVATLAVAAKFEANGFVVEEVTLSAIEKRYLDTYAPSKKWGEKAWIVTCSGIVQQGSDGGVHCGSLPGIEVVDSGTASGTGLGEADRAFVKAMAPNASLFFRYLLPKDAPTAEQWKQASVAVAEYNSITEKLAKMQPLVETHWNDPRLPPRIKGAYLHAAKLMVELAQPVNEWNNLQRDRQKDSPQVGVLLAAVFTAGVLKFVVIGGIVVVALALATACAWVLINGSLKLMKANAELQSAWDEDSQWARDLLEDPTLTPKERRELMKYLETREDNRPKPPADPVDLMNNLVKAAVPLTILGMAVAFGAPMLFQAGRAGGQEIKRVRQRRADRQDHADEE